MSATLYMFSLNVSLTRFECYISLFFFFLNKRNLLKKKINFSGIIEVCKVKCTRIYYELEKKFLFSSKIHFPEKVQQFYFDQKNKNNFFLI